MAMVDFSMILSAMPGATGNNTTALNATGESASVIGRIRLESGSGPKTLSSAGGRIAFLTTAVAAWANAGTTVRAGVQDVSTTTGLEAGTFDAYADLVPGTETIAGAVWNSFAIETGTKSISDGDIIAFVVEMTARAGADEVTLSRWSGTQGDLGPSTGGIFPYGSTDTGALTKTTNPLVAAIVFDDGTLGWIEGYGPLGMGTIAAEAYNTGSAADEFGAAITLPAKVTIRSFAFRNTDMGSTDTFVWEVTSDPLGSPSSIEVITPDVDMQVNTSATGIMIARLATPLTLNPGTVYGFAQRATSANSISQRYMDFGTGNTVLKNAAQPFTTLKRITRDGGSGAYTETQTYHQPLIVLYGSQIDDGSGGGGGGFIIGG